MPTAFYRCKKCNREFNTLADARMCEKNHLTISKSRIKSHGIHTHPYEIEVTFSNGDTKVYIAGHLQ